MNEREELAAARAKLPVAPQSYDAVIFDLDGVITDTRDAHEDAWKHLFDEYRKERMARGDPGFEPFDHDDYRQHLDGKPRYDGVRDFLASRDIDLPWGDPDDDPGKETVCGLGNRKNRHYHAWLNDNRVKTYDDALAFLHAVRDAGIRTAIISSSRNCKAVLENAGISDLFEVRVDGNVMARLELPGKPDPAIFLRAAERLGVAPNRAAVFEDALAGVEAGARGGFALVVGVDRTGSGEHGDMLRDRGADTVTDDLRDLLPESAAYRRPDRSEGDME